MQMTVARAMKSDAKILPLRYCPLVSLYTPLQYMHPASNGPIRRDATRHKVLLSDGFHETPTKVEVQNYTRFSRRLQIFNFTKNRHLGSIFHLRESLETDEMRYLMGMMCFRFDIFALSILRWMREI